MFEYPEFKIRTEFDNIFLIIILSDNKTKGGYEMRIDCHAHGYWEVEPKPESPGRYVDECRKRGIDKIVLIQSEDRRLFETAE